MWIKKEKLEGNFVVLEPLNEVHIEPLKKAVLDGEPWKLWFANVPNPENMSDYVKQAIHDAKNGNIAFAVRAKS